MFLLLPADKTNSFLHLFSTQPSSLFLRNARLKTLSLPNNLRLYNVHEENKNKQQIAPPEFKTEPYIRGRRGDLHPALPRHAHLIISYTPEQVYNDPQQPSLMPVPFSSP